MLSLRAAPLRVGSAAPARAMPSRPCVVPSFHSVMAGVSVDSRREGEGHWRCSELGRALRVCSC
jgi:hypothetical protein